MKKVTLLFMVLCLTVSVFAGETDKIGFMLKLQKKLELSQTQIDKLMDLQTGLKKVHVNQEAKYKLAEIDLKDLMHAKETNLKPIEKKMQELAGLKAGMDFTNYETYFKAEKILTEEQKKKFETFMKDWQHKQMAKKEKDEHMNVMLHDGEKAWHGKDVFVDVDVDQEGGHKKVTVKKSKDGEGEVWVQKSEDGKVFKMKMTDEEDMDKWVDKMEGDVHVEIIGDGEHEAFFIKEKPGETFEYVIKKGEDGKVHILEKNEDGELVEIKESEGEHKVILKRVKEKKVVEREG